MPMRFRSSRHIMTGSWMCCELEFGRCESIQPTSPPASIHQTAVETIESEAAAQAFVARLEQSETIAVQCLLSGSPGVRADMQGIALSSKDLTAFIPLDVHEYMRPIITLFHETTRLKAVHDLKLTLLAFHRIGVTLTGPYVDTMIADYLLNPNRRDHQLDTLALELLDHRLGTRAKEPASPTSLFQAETASREQIAERAAVIAKRSDHARSVEDQGSLNLFQRSRNAACLGLADIERNGCLLDVDGLQPE